MAAFLFFPDPSLLSYNFREASGYLCNENNPLDIIDLCPQLSPNTQLFNTVPAPSLAEVVQRGEEKVYLSNTPLPGADQMLLCSTSVLIDSAQYYNRQGHGS